VKRPIRDKGPLRKIVGPDGLGRVELECGHSVASEAIYRTRCGKCKHGVPVPERGGGAPEGERG
jgi:hypothetical protein